MELVKDFIFLADVIFVLRGWKFLNAGSFAERLLLDRGIGDIGGLRRDDCTDLSRVCDVHGD
jgi:hypothetical protein